MPIAGDFPGASKGAIVLLELRTSDGQVELDIIKQARIALALRQMYDHLVNQPVPEHFVELIAMWERKQSERP